MQRLSCGVGVGQPVAEAAEVVGAYVDHAVRGAGKLGLDAFGARRGRRIGRGAALACCQQHAAGQCQYVQSESFAGSSRARPYPSLLLFGETCQMHENQRTMMRWRTARCIDDSQPAEPGCARLNARG